MTTTTLAPRTRAGAKALLGLDNRHHPPLRNRPLAQAEDPANLRTRVHLAMSVTDQGQRGAEAVARRQRQTGWDEAPTWSRWHQGIRAEVRIIRIRIRNKTRTRTNLILMLMHRFQVGDPVKDHSKLRLRSQGPSGPRVRVEDLEMRLARDCEPIAMFQIPQVIQTKV